MLCHMPYIITTRRPCTCCTHCGYSHREGSPECLHAQESTGAVATLDEAQRYGRRIMADAGQWSTAAIDELPESGGTIGPLPDGTTIEVKRVSWSRLAEHTTGGWDAERGRFRAPAYEADILAAFNSR